MARQKTGRSRVQGWRFAPANTIRPFTARLGAADDRHEKTTHEYIRKPLVSDYAVLSLTYLFGLLLLISLPALVFAPFGAFHVRLTLLFRLRISRRVKLPDEIEINIHLLLPLPA